MERNPQDLEELPPEDALIDLVAIESQLEVLEEVAQLRDLVAMLDAIEIDSKAEVLRNGLEDLRSADPGIKVLIFTQFRDTQSYLMSLTTPAWIVRSFHGQLSPAEKDDAIAKFRDEPGPQLLIATEAGGEGRNLQFVHTMVNYDLPWNPMRIEQRIGRLDRIGQKHVVTIVNLAVRDTIEERVLTVLDHRIRVFENTIGGLDPILGNVETDLRRLFLTHGSEDEVTRYEAGLEQRVFEARRAEERMADLIMDTKSFRQDEVKRLLERSAALDSVSLKRFVTKAVRQLGASYEPDPTLDGVHVFRFQGRFLQEFPEIAKEGTVRRVTFDSSVARDFETVEFLAFGHELVDAVTERVRSRAYGATTARRMIESSEMSPATGWFFTFILSFEGVTRSKEVFPVFIPERREAQPDPTTAGWLLDRSSRLEREEWPAGLPVPGISDEILNQAEGLALTRLMERREELNLVNRTRLDQERTKLERYFDYRQRAAAEKLASVQRTFDNVSVSEDIGVQRIIPVWAKNLENARRVVDGLAAERMRRIGELAGRDQVSAQHEMMTGAYVAIVPPGDRAHGSSAS